MTYGEILTHIYRLGRFGMRPGLERIRALLAALSDPQEALSVVHVAGTNGKGSTAAFLSAILTAAGHRTGLFTSPHLIRFTERIRIDGREIAEGDAASVGERVLAAAPAGTTFFEIATAMAYLHFAEQGARLAVMEVGMGGRFDATNAAGGILSVITPIALDHREYLGDDLRSIAGEKAGVVKPGRPVVVSGQDPAAMAVIEEACARLASPLHRFGAEFSAFWEGDLLSYQGGDWRLSGLRPGIGGSYQLENAACALRAAETLSGLGLAVDRDSAVSGIGKASWPGRMEMVSDAPPILLDGAHNPAGAAALASALDRIGRDRLIMVIGVMANKDLDGILGHLLPLADRVIAVTPGMPQALPSCELADRCARGGGGVTDAGTVASGLEEAGRMAGRGDLILVCGSLFTVGEARACLLHEQFEPCRG